MMFRKVAMITLLLIAGALIAPSVQAGGWATITVIDLPQKIEMGEPVTIQFVVRQHGRHPMEGLSPTITAQLGNETVTVPAEAMKRPGHYWATLNLPRAGKWTWQIDAFSMAVEMPPLTVTVPDAFWESPLGQLLALVAVEPPAGEDTSPVAYGQKLFAAKGCITCHAHPALPNYWSIDIGVDLSTYDRDPTFIKAWLQNAAEFTTDRMPTLELTDAEIDALIAFLEEGP